MYTRPHPSMIGRGCERGGRDHTDPTASAQVLTTPANNSVTFYQILLNMSWVQTVQQCQSY